MTQMHTMKKNAILRDIGWLDSLKQVSETIYALNIV